MTSISSPEKIDPQSSAPERPPEEVSAEGPNSAEATFSPETSDVVEQMKPEGKKFFSRLFDKIKSSDIVQNISDRYQVWRDERLAQRVQDRIDHANGQQQYEQGQAAAAHKAAERSQADLSKLEELMGKVGKKVGEETYAKVAVEAINHDDTQLKHEARDQQITGQIEDLRLAKASFTEQAEQAKGRLDSRLEEKININNKSLEEYGQRETRVELQLASNEAEREKNAQHEVELESFLETVDRSSAIYSDLKKAIQEARRERVRLDEINDILIRERDSIRAKISKLEGKNSDLVAKREKIIPASQRKPKESPTEESVTISSPAPEIASSPEPASGPQPEPQPESASEPEPESELIHADKWTDLYRIVRDLGEVQGSQEKFTSQRLIELIELVRAGEAAINMITRSRGIRENVQRLLDLEKKQTSTIELRPGTARRGKIIITTNDEWTRKLTYNSDAGPCMIETDSKGHIKEVKKIDELTDDDLEPFCVVSGDRLALLGLGKEITARLKAIEGQENKLSIGNVTFDWNQAVGKKSGLQIELPRKIDPTMSLEDISSVKEYILKALAKKLVPGEKIVNVTHLNKKIVAMVDKFLKKF